MGRWLSVGAIAVVVFASACTGSGDSDDAGTASSESDTATSTTRRGRASLEMRPVEAFLPPDGPQELQEPPPGTEILGSRGGATAIRYLVGPVAMTGTAVRSTRAVDLQGPFGWVIALELNRQGRQDLNALAAMLYDEQPPQNTIALVVDGEVLSAPAFQTNRFDGSTIQISGDFTEAEAEALAAALAP